MKKKVKGKKKEYKLSYKKIVVFLLIIIFVLIIYNIISNLNKENESIQTASLIDNGALKNIETSSYVDVSRYIVYGTHLNLEGDIKINENPSIQNAEIVVKNVSGEGIAEEFEGTDIYGENGRVGVEGYLIELRYINVDEDLSNILRNRELYMQAIIESINNYYKIKI